MNTELERQLLRALAAASNDPVVVGLAEQLEAALARDGRLQQLRDRAILGGRTITPATSLEGAIPMGDVQTDTPLGDQPAEEAPLGIIILDPPSDGGVA